MLVGNYVEESIVTPIVAAALAGGHVAIISKPGWGKTSGAYATARAITDKVVILNLNPSTPPSRVEGRVSTVGLLNDREEYIYADTAFDPNVNIVILDELFRANVAVDDALLPLLEPHEATFAAIHGHKTIIATSNWVGTNERLAALRDRFDQIVFVRAALPAIGDLVQASLTQNKANFAYRVPTWEEVLRVRSLEPGLQAIATITDYLQLLYEEAIAQNNQRENKKKGAKIDEAHFSPRRFDQWAQLLFRFSAYLLGETDFDHLPSQAKKAMEFAFPAVTEEESAAWQSVCRNVGNQGAAAARAILGQALAYYKGLEEEFKEKAGRADAVSLVTKASKQLADFTEQLVKAVGEDSDTYRRGEDLLNELLQGLLNGRDLNAVAKKIQAI